MDLLSQRRTQTTSFIQLPLLDRIVDVHIELRQPQRYGAVVAVAMSTRRVHDVLTVQPRSRRPTSWSDDGLAEHGVDSVDLVDAYDRWWRWRHGAVGTATIMSTETEMGTSEYSSEYKLN
jgi:aryl carrier-like protein